MYKKILWWVKTHTEKPLPYSLLVACIFHEKVEPEPYFESTAKTLDLKQFKIDCSESNQFAGKDSVIEREFKDATGIEISDLISSEIWREIIELDSINDYFANNTFDSQNEIKVRCKKIYSEYLNEKCFTDPKKTLKIYGQRGASLITQMFNLSKYVDSMEKWAEGTANQFWFGSNAIRCITRMVNELLKCEQTPELYRKSIIALKDAFKFSDFQIEMLRYAICQSKYGDCPASKNKAVYIWGKEKGSGKTTIAAMIVSILNGEKDHLNIARYKSTLAQELQFQTFVAPKICSCRAVILDEAAPKDTSKMYNIFKTRITSDGATVRFIHKNQVDLSGKANYWMTSNDPPWEFVQDESERRFLEFNIEKRYQNLTTIEIYNLFLNFIQQCKKEPDWEAWYDSMQLGTEVKGMESKNIDDIRSYFETDEFFKIINNGASQVTVGTFYQQVNFFEKNVSKQTVMNCVVAMFGEPVKKSTWRKKDIIEVLSNIKMENNELFEGDEKTEAQKTERYETQLEFDDLPY